jgi:hypothetical protein
VVKGQCDLSRYDSPMLAVRVWCAMVVSDGPLVKQ